MAVSPTSGYGQIYHSQDQDAANFWAGIFDGELDVIKIFEKSGRSLDILADNGFSPLMMLASLSNVTDGHIAIAEYLKDKVDLDRQNSAGDTALHIVARVGLCRKLGNILVLAGARTDIPNQAGETYSSIAIQGSE